MDSTLIRDTAFLSKILAIQQQLIASDFNLDNFMQLVVESMQKLTPATGVVIELVEGSEMVYRAATGSVMDFVGLRLPIANSISGLCVQQHKILCSDDTTQDSRVNAAACKKIGVRSLVVSPLIHRDEAIGVLKILSDRPRAFTEKDIQTLQLMAGFIAGGLVHQLYYQQSRRLAAVVESTDEAIIIRSLDGTIESWNAGAVKLYGYQEQEMIGKSIEILYPENKKNEFYSSLDQIKKGLKIDYFDTERVHKNGHLILVAVLVSPIKNDENKIIGSCSISRDISELKKLLSLKNDFISMVSHELRTPLTSIQGSLALLASGACGELPDKALKILTIGKQNSERLIRLINDILDVQKFESGKQIFHLQSADMKDLINDSVQANEAYADQFNLKIIITHNDSAPIKVDIDRIMQVLANLISNAIKFSNGPTIQISATRLKNRIRVAVRNKGVGIPAEFRGRIFEKFSQLQQANLPIKGTGLGLNISKEIIEKHQGKIGFESVPNEETVFYFELPLEGSLK